MKILRSIFKKKGTETVSSWKQHPSLFDVLSAQLREKDHLPDDFVLPSDRHSSQSVVSISVIRQLGAKLKKVALTGDKSAALDFYEAAVKLPQVIGVIDLFLEEISNYALPIEPHLFTFAHDLAFRSNHINSVKFGIALLGLSQNKLVVDKLKVLAHYEKFTVYVAIALLNLSDNPEKDLFELGGKLNGWSKMQVIFRLAQICKSEDVKHWLLSDGFKNNLNDNCLAPLCAKHGGLHLKLREQQVDKEFYLIASLLIEKLLKGEQQDFNAYNNIPEVLENYMRHAVTHAKDIKDFLLLQDIQHFLEKHLQLMDKIYNWDDNRIANCIIANNELLSSNIWKQLVAQVLSNPEHSEYKYAIKASRSLQ